MVPITLNRQNIFQWIIFGLLEVWRVLCSLVKRTGSREEEVTLVVERDAIRNDPDSVLRVMDEFAQSNRFLMNVGEEKGALLRRTLKDSNAKRVLEMGAYCGYSAVLMGSELQDRQGELVSLEIDGGNAAMARRVVDHAGLSDLVTIHVGSAAEGIAKLEGQFDLVFIDHWKDDYLPDLKRLEEKGLLSPGAVIVADNVGIFSNTLQDYLNYVRKSGRYTSDFYPLPMEYNQSIEDGVEVSVFKAAGQRVAA